MFDYFWTDDTQVNVIRVDGVGNVVAYFPEDEGYSEAVEKVSGFAGVIDRKPTLTASEIRSYRYAELISSDWTQVADAPVDQAAWATYRQALRDVPEQEGFPNTVVWPVKP